jgi:glycosyltransferase involved in cell wall biosynthesis
MQRNLRFTRHLPVYGWRPVILTVRPQDFRGEPVEAGWQAKVPATVPVYRARVLRPLEIALKLRSLWRRATTGRHPTSPAQHAEPQPTVAATPGKTWVERWIDPWFTTPDAQIGWLPYAVWRGLYALHAERITLLYSSGPPYTAHLIGLVLKWVTHLPWVVDFRDPWSRRPWDNALMRRGVRYRVQVRLEDLVIRHADKVISNTEPMGQEFCQRYRAQPAEKFAVITNGYDVENFEGIVACETPPEGVFTITHAGSLYGRRDPKPLLQAIALLRDQGVLQPGTLQLQLVGRLDLALQVEAAVQALGLQEWVTLIPAVPYADSIKYLMRSHLLLLLQPDAPLQVPGKLFEYIYLQRPILALTGQGATADIIRKHQLGEVVDPRDSEAIAAAIMPFYRGLRSRKSLMYRTESALSCFHGQLLVRQLAEIFNSIKK